MEIYLVRHGEAEAEHVEPTQPLRERGRADVIRVARQVAAARATVAEIRHSPKLRAAQTAEILAAQLKPPRGLQPVDYLAPEADPGTAQDAVEKAAEPLMLVGHLPHLARLASLLLVGNPSRRIVRLRPGTTLRLEREEHGWVLGWMLTPEIAAPDAGC